MTRTAPVAPAARIEAEGARTATFYGMVLAHIGAFGVLFFWIIGAILLASGNGGQIVELRLEGILSTLYWAYPFVVVASLAAWLLYLARLDRAALAVAGAPVALAALYYLFLVSFRSV